MAMLPLNADGRLYHLGLKRGELAPRILTVGDYGRAERIAKESLKNIVFQHTSDRGFSTWTGYFDGELVSIVSIGMGLPMMDFMLREARTIVDGPMAVIRFGTCGSLNAEDEIGSICVSTASCLVSRNPNYFIAKRSSASSKTTTPYAVSELEQSDTSLTSLLLSSLSEEKEVVAVSGINATADSFYSSQGRRVGDPASNTLYFVDENEELIDSLTRSTHPVRTLEMETFQLLHLANCASTTKIHATAMVMIVANRPKNLFAFSDERKELLERIAGRCALQALSKQSLL
ncbi:uridine phosphorylase [Mitosporidium daphniae]|uniref:Uridine phosphorylase n=1 Tax=Mitosporidium daphniae TaxID=1485682 RepID=A0A098VW22_9MICR|nr:uridine phosphorylase [Mitosporidium daphniae]KGG51906.1 uridine phosphorylase [Mitosporidium daphniae]|eukprot:XP_013238333.1 uridine phosphorylase [Mitosporidium daphniae]